MNLLANLSTLFLSLGLLVFGTTSPIGSSNHSTEFTGAKTLSEVYGTVRDSKSGEPLLAANILLREVNKGTMSGVDGHYILSDIEPGHYTLEVNYIGYTKEIRKIELKDGTRLKVNFSLQASEVELLEQVVVTEQDMVEPSEDSEGIINKRHKRNGKMDTKSTANYQMYSGANGVASPNVHFTPPEHNTEAYDRIYENGWKEVLGNPLSTFSIDVDAASYANMRRFINAGQAPPADAVRIEELVNYFDYDYTQPINERPFNIITEISDCPWNASAKLVHIGLQGKEIDYSEASPTNLVFLIDVSGSMGQANKLPLVQQSLNKLVDALGEKDRIALVVYAGAAGEVLASTPASQKSTIKSAINNLRSGGSTAGGAGINLAYKIAQQNLIEGGNNRVILCTDGDFNVGASSNSDMIRLIEEKRKSGVFITVCGFGMGNYKDSKMENIADKGNGNYYYIDSEKEAQKVFVTEMRSTLFTIAKDVKLQVEFNPAKVKSYRLIGYENRLLNSEDFDDDTKDAGELGAGHTVTALYEVHLNETDELNDGGDQGMGFNKQQELPTEELKYQRTTVTADAIQSTDILTLKLRYKKPDGKTSLLIEHALKYEIKPLELSSNNFRWSASVAAFGMLLRDSQFKGTASFPMVLNLANGAMGGDVHGYRAEFLELVKKSASGLATR